MRSWNDWMTMSIALALGAVACGGATSSATGASSEAGADGSSSGSSSSSGGGNSSGGTDGASTDDGGDDGSLLIVGGSSSGSSTDSGTEASSGGMPLGDGGQNQIACGGTPCDSTSQVCCATRNGRMCVTTGTCTTGDSLACSGSNSCTAGSGDVCCEVLAANGTIRTRCDTACPAGSRQLCTTKDDCKAGYDCRKGLDGYGACVEVREGGAADAASE
jgi:hypothetical protein